MNVQRAEVMGCELVVGGATVEAFGLVRALFEGYDRVFSRFRAASELSHVNAADAEWVRVSPVFAAALRSALAAARTTDGLVDPTLGAALEAAGYDRDFALLRPDPRPPRAGAPGAWTRIHLRRRLLLPRPGIRLDLNGVVKAVAVDAALELVGARGYVAAGGDLAATAPVQVELPGGGSVRLARGALATSGTLSRRWERGGTVLHHLIDPRTGSPARSPWAAVTVAGATCFTADVAAKAAFLAGDEGPSWLDARRLPGRFLTEGGEIVTTARRSLHGRLPPLLDGARRRRARAARGPRDQQPASPAAWPPHVAALPLPRLPDLGGIDLPRPGGRNRQHEWLGVRRLPGRDRGRRRAGGVAPRPRARLQGCAAACGGGECLVLGDSGGGWA